MSGSNNPLPIIAWDSTIFLACFKKEADKPLADIRLVIEQVEAGQIALYVSVLSYTEVLDTAKSSNAGTLFRDFMLRSNVVPMNIDMRIADLAARLRQETIAQNSVDESVPKLKTPDAIIAASAMKYEARELHSFDPDLLALSAHQIVDGLIVVPPRGIRGERSLIQDEADEDTNEQHA